MPHFNFRPAIQRFNAKWRMNALTGCWIWTAKLDRDGYGSMWGGKELGKEDNIQAPRVAWMLHRGPIPDGMLICHRCDNRACVNPEHLFLGTQADNSADMVEKGRSKRKPTYKHYKIPREDVAAIRDGNEPAEEVAERYGVKLSHIYRIRWRKIWADVP